MLMTAPKRTQTDIRIRLLRVRLYCQARHSLFGGRCRDIDVATATDIHIHESIMEKRTDELTSPTRTVLGSIVQNGFWLAKQPTWVRRALDSFRSGSLLRSIFSPFDRGHT